MKKLIITGAGSYVGTWVERYLREHPAGYEVKTVDMLGESWKLENFSGFDAVLHVAGIVHQPSTKDDPDQAALYDRVNHLLPIAVAEKAKAEGVKQFIFMSTEAVYGLHAPLGSTVTITADTPLNPKDNYGISKRKAEEGLQPLAEENFKLAVLRPPMIYGKGCKGNYQTLRKLALKLPIFPWVKNQRSMLYIENLAEFIRLILEDQAEGLFCPQDQEYVSTCEMVNLIAHFHGNNILMVKGVTWGLKLLRPVTGAVDKAFGSLCYDESLSRYPRDYQIRDLQSAIEATET